MATSIAVVTSPTGSVVPSVPFTVQATLSGTDSSAASISNLRLIIQTSGAQGNADPSIIGVFAIAPSDSVAIPVSGSGTIVKTAQAVLFNPVSSSTAQVYIATVVCTDTAGVVTSASSAVVTCSNPSWGIN